MQLATFQARTKDKGMAGTSNARALAAHLRLLFAGKELYNVHLRGNSMRLCIKSLFAAIAGTSGNYFASPATVIMSAGSR